MLIFEFKCVYCNIFLKVTVSEVNDTVIQEKIVNTSSVTTTAQANSFHAAFSLHSNSYWKEIEG